MRGRLRQLLVPALDDDRRPVEAVEDVVELHADAGIGAHPLDLLADGREAVERVPVDSRNRPERCTACCSGRRRAGPGWSTGGSPRTLRSSVLESASGVPCRGRVDRSPAVAAAGRPQPPSRRRRADRRAHVPTLNLHQAFDNREAKARAAALGREERLEDLVADRRRGCPGRDRALRSVQAPSSTAVSISTGWPSDAWQALRTRLSITARSISGSACTTASSPPMMTCAEVSGARARGGFRDDCPQRDRTPARRLRAREEQDILDGLPQTVDALDHRRR